ncbi:restriction endonuclease subunit S [Prolixibacteraceae bacterium]|nr:restriction endonuclease subunit S [Prolixibacteraceae bacterium]
MTITDINTKYKKYPKYKDSGVEWLGEIPEEWKAIKMKYLFRDISVKDRADETLLSVTQDKGVVPRSWVENRMVMPSGNLESFKFIEKGDFSISLRSFEGGLEYCHHNGIISPAYTVLKKDKELNEFYYKFLFKSKSFISEMQTSVVGIREGKNISYPILSYSLIPVPCYDQQKAIANFLDDKTAKIDQAMAQKQKLIALLKERKQILIQNVVTGKVVYNEKENAWTAPTHTIDSGVEWIGKIPKGWEVKKLKHLIKKSFSGGTPSTDKLDFWDGGIPWISSVDVKKDLLEVTTREISQKGLLHSSSNIAPKGSLVFVTRSGILQHTFALSILGRDMAINQDIKCLIFSHLIFSSYFQKLIIGNNSKILVETRQQAATVESINMELFFNLFIPLPQIHKQQKIVDYIETQSAKIDKAIALQEQQIEKLKEYKSVLIDSAVTGKIKIC